MNNSAVMGIISGDDMTTRLKRVGWPGQSSPGHDYAAPGKPIEMNTVFLDNLFPQTGLASSHDFYAPITGTYQLYLEVDWPHYGAVGWTHGYSGAGGADTWMQWWRGGTLVEDNIGRVNIGLPDDGQHHWVYCGPVTRVLQAGDFIRCVSSNGATGVGPAAWDARFDMTWYPGVTVVGNGGAQLGVVPVKPDNVSGPTGDTQNDMNIGGAGNDGWLQGDNCIYTNYVLVIPYADPKNAGYRLQGRITLNATYTGAGPYARFLSASDTWASAIMESPPPSNPWTSAWVEINPPMATNIQVRLQISRVSGGIGKNIHVNSCLQEFQWVKP